MVQYVRCRMHCTSLDFQALPLLASRYNLYAWRERAWKSRLALHNQAISRFTPYLPVLCSPSLQVMVESDRAWVAQPTIR